jgi:hypothetical protein
MAFVGLNHFMYSLLIASVTFLFGLSGVVNQLSHRFTSFEYAYYFFFFLTHVHLFFLLLLFLRTRALGFEAASFHLRCTVNPQYRTLLLGTSFLFYFFFYLISIILAQSFEPI